MKNIKVYESFEVNEKSNAENLKVILASLKDATDEQVEQISNMLSKKLTFGNIMDMAEVFHIENKIVK